MTRRTACGLLLAGFPAAKLAADARPDSFRVYSESPRLFLRPQRLRLLRRERERRSLRWDQFETLWAGHAEFPEPGWTAALRYQIAQEREAGERALSWAAGSASDIRQIAIVADWCGPLATDAQRRAIFAKLHAVANAPSPRNLDAARDKALAAIALSEQDQDTAERALTDVFEKFWTGTFLPAVRNARLRVTNAEACALYELLHAYRDNLSFDLRETFPEWFKPYPIFHVMAHYPPPFPGSENEYRIPAEKNIAQTGPDLKKASLSRAAELALVAFDANAPETQLVQGFVMNDRFLMRGTFGIAYEMLWANPYQPGLSYYHIPPAQHDEIGGQLFVRSSWDDDAAWVGFFDGQLQLFKEGSATRMDPNVTREPLDIEEATVFFARAANRFQVPQRPADTMDDVFIVGLEPRKAYHIEVDGREMYEDTADPGGILFLPALTGGAGVRLGPAPVAK
jgi:hypothetical protein